MKEDDVVITLFDSLRPSFDHLITTLQMLPMKEFTLDFITTRLMNEMLKMKENKPQIDDMTMVLHEPRAFDNNERRPDNPKCYNCTKLGHIAHHCQNKRTINANIVRSNNIFLLTMKDELCRTFVTKWIVDSGALQHLTPHFF